MEKEIVSLFCVKKTFAFNQLIKVNDTIARHTALLIPNDQMVEVCGEDGEPTGELQNPERYAHCETGYANIPKGFFRVTRLPDGTEEPDAPDAPSSPEGMDIPTKIIRALQQLDPDDDLDWTTTGEPRMDRVIDLVGEQVTRNEVEEAYPGFTRETVALG